MHGEVMYVTFHGGWLVFGALAAGWVALLVANRLKTLNVLLDAAREEAAVALASLAAHEQGRHDLARHVELDQLATAIGAERITQTTAKEQQN